MGANGDTVLVKEELLATISELNRKGYTIPEISKIVGYNQSYVWTQIELVKKRYKEAQVEEREALVQEKLAQYADIRKEAWEAWQVSKNDLIKQIDEVVETPNGMLTKNKLITEKSLPMNEYLRTIITCLQAEEELLGLTNDAKINVKQITLNWDALLEPPTRDMLNTVEHKLANMIPEGIVQQQAK